MSFRARRCWIGWRRHRLPNQRRASSAHRHQASSPHLTKPTGRSDSMIGRSRGRWGRDDAYDTPARIGGRWLRDLALVWLARLGQSSRGGATGSGGNRKPMSARPMVDCVASCLIAVLGNICFLTPSRVGRWGECLTQVRPCQDPLREVRKVTISGGVDTFRPDLNCGQPKHYVFVSASK